MEFKERLLQEVGQNFSALERACCKLFGEDKSRFMLSNAQQFLPVDKYEFTPFTPTTPAYVLAQNYRDTLFGVQTNLEGEMWFGAKAKFVQKPRRITTSPLLFFPEEGVEAHVREHFAAGSNAPYFCAWLHEYSHYLVYSLQEVPYQAVLSMVLSYFQQQGIDGELAEVLERGLSYDLEAGSVLYSLLDTTESSGACLASHLMLEMEMPFSPSPNTDMFSTFFRLPFSKFIQNVEHWHQLQAKRSPYLQEFWKELITIPVKKVAAK